MKFALATALALALAVSADAFAPTAFAPRTRTSLSERVDASTLIEEAKAASEKFGAASPEARIAWEAVEEVDASDNTEASKPSMDVECELDEDAMNSACADYSSKLDQLSSILEQQQPIINQISEIAQQVKSIKLSVPADPSKKSAVAANPALAEALKKAEEITKEKGITSPEARVAWDDVEEISASGSHNSAAAAEAAATPSSADECLLESAKEACLALEELQRVINLNKSDSRYQG